MKSLRKSGNLPAFVPNPESEYAIKLQNFIEQIRYERIDGPALPLRVVISGTDQGMKASFDILLEETFN